MMWASTKSTRIFVHEGHEVHEEEIKLRVRSRPWWTILFRIFVEHPVYSSAIVTLLSTSPCFTLSTTSWPLRTCPNTVCFPSSQSVFTCVMKNWLPLVLGLALAIDIDPRWCFCGLFFTSS